MDDTQAPVIGVYGASGGVGASVFAAALAAAAGKGVLIDLDGLGGGIDVLLGITEVRGARWSSVQVDGGRVDSVDLAQGLPRWRGVSVLAADQPPATAAIDAVVAAARPLGPVVLDVGRCLVEWRDVVSRCSLVVVVADGECRSVAAARAAASVLDPAPLGLVLRRGSISGVEAAALISVPLVGELPPIVRRRDVGGSRLPRGVTRVASGILDGVRE